MNIFIDAGIEHITIKEGDKTNVIKNNDKIENLIPENLKNKEKIITGKLGDIVKNIYGGEVILSSAAMWFEAQQIAKKEGISVGIIELSASGYNIIAVDKNGALINDILITNPKCGAGSGINLRRILEKLDLDLEDVDNLLCDYLGKKGKEKRKKVPVRADRCGVFSSSATISDKNQGIPLDHALAVTMKSEILKACKKMIKVEKVILTGRVFLWKYMQDCAKDYLNLIGVNKIDFDEFFLLKGIEDITSFLGKNFRKQTIKISKEKTLIEYPSFSELKEKYENLGLYKRINNEQNYSFNNFNIDENTPINIALDIGSTMAKIVVCNLEEKILFVQSYDNHGDTVQTIKHIFSELSKKSSILNIQHIGLTGSGRYQVQKVLEKVYPSLQDRIFVLVENYAHARGSINYVKNHIKEFNDINNKYCVLVDIGGEDTKISIIDLVKEDLFDNVMNIKCSAGTGSLMDTLKTLFGISSIKEACDLALESKKAYEINATCAVFLMENAKKMQAKGFNKSEILASCNFAIVENMARTLWNQIEFPKNAVVLLHGQTMLSDPLPLAVTHRIQKFSKMYCLVPPIPGHRACIGLIRTITQKDTSSQIIQNKCNLNDFINVNFEKTIFYCHGAACGDKKASCARTMLTTQFNEKNLTILLGGCTAVNELSNEKKEQIPDSYNEIWKFIDSNMPKSSAKNRLIIPRSFALSEWAFFLAKIFENIGIPVFVDNITEKDILEGQPHFKVDVCAPLIGAVGQFTRLANEDHGIIVSPQIIFLPTKNLSLGKTCSTNQGGVAIAINNAKINNPKARFSSLELNFKDINSFDIAFELYNKAQDIFKFYNKSISINELEKAVVFGIEQNSKLKTKIAQLANKYVKYAIENKLNISIVCAREYILNPGIYDSHTGKLLKDKGIIALPSYAFDACLDKNYSYVYWRNPHDLITKINAVANKTLHSILVNKSLAESIKKIEKNLTDTTISIVQVSTFRCGPDSVITPTINNITKNIPSLFIQSDAMIKELAHLENRINTHVNQITKKLSKDVKNKFNIKKIDDIGVEEINKETDVVYFPTLHDNRALTSALKSSGITVIDNYDDLSYNLENKIRFGRKFVGDSVCAPLAGVFADIVYALEDFKQKKANNDPLVKTKTRILIFDNKGDGPCRQGQYFEQHKLFIYDLIKNTEYEDKLKLLVAKETNGYNVGIEEYSLLLAFEGAILHGIFHTILFKGSLCENEKEFNDYYNDYLNLKKQIYSIIENFKPSCKNKFLLNILNNCFPLNYGIKYFTYGLYNNHGITKILKSFVKKWDKLYTKENNINKNENLKNKRIKIYIEGEAYMRGAQIEDIFRSIIDSIGFNSFELDYSPIWLYIELLMEYNLINLNDEIKKLENTEPKNKKIKENKKSIKIIKFAKFFFRKFLVNPLYNATNISIPHKVNKVLKKSTSLLPNIKPQGELPAYVGEAIIQSEKQTDLFFNVAPEGCMVSSMGQAMTNAIQFLTKSKIKIQDLFSLNGEVDEEQLQLSILKVKGPIGYYFIPKKN